jgi:hypothetical protein
MSAHLIANKVLNPLLPTKDGAEHLPAKIIIGQTGIVKVCRWFVRDIA